MTADETAVVGFASPRPRVWTVFATLAIAFAVGILLSIAVAVSIALPAAIGGASQSTIVDSLTKDPVNLILMALPVQLSILGLAMAHALVSRGRAESGSPSVRETLGLRRPSIGAWVWCAVLLGSGVPFALSIGAASVMPSMSDGEALLEMWTEMPTGVAVVWVLFISLLPGVGEEILFRGLVQRRLLRYVSPAVAIGTTSVLFALVHVDPPAMGLALVLGVWLGIVAWRTDSVLPGIAIHASVNGLWNLGQIVVRQLGVSDEVLNAALVAVGTLSLLAFAVAVWALSRAVPGPARVAAAVPVATR